MASIDEEPAKFDPKHYPKGINANFLEGSTDEVIACAKHGIRARPYGLLHEHACRPIAAWSVRVAVASSEMHRRSSSRCGLAHVLSEL
jgi:hypothetical protein